MIFALPLYRYRSRASKGGRGQLAYLNENKMLYASFDKIVFENEKLKQRRVTSTLFAWKFPATSSFLFPLSLFLSRQTTLVGRSIYTVYVTWVTHSSPLDPSLYLFSRYTLTAPLFPAIFYSGRLTFTSISWPIRGQIYVRRYNGRRTTGRVYQVRRIRSRRHDSIYAFSRIQVRESSCTFGNNRLLG